MFIHAAFGAGRSGGQWRYSILMIIAIHGEGASMKPVADLQESEASMDTARNH